MDYCLKALKALTLCLVKHNLLLVQSMLVVLDCLPVPALFGDREHRRTHGTLLPGMELRLHSSVSSSLPKKGLELCQPLPSY